MALTPEQLETLAKAKIINSIFDIGIAVFVTWVLYLAIKNKENTEKKKLFAKIGITIVWIAIILKLIFRFV